MVVLFALLNFVCFASVNCLDYYVSINGTNPGQCTTSSPALNLSSCIGRLMYSDEKQVTVHLIGEEGMFVESVPCILINKSVTIIGGVEYKISDDVMGYMYVVRNSSSLTLNQVNIVYNTAGISIFQFVLVEIGSVFEANFSSFNQITNVEYNESLFSLSGKAYFHNSNFTNFRVYSSICTIFNGEFEILYFNECLIKNISTSGEIIANVASLINVRVDKVRLKLIFIILFFSIIKISYNHEQYNRKC
jgi:hypothetical protein